MKRFMLSAITVALVAVNPLASADDGWNGGHGGGSYHSGGGHGDGHGPGYGTPPPQGKNNKGRRPHYGNGSTHYYAYNGGYKGYGHPGYHNPRPYYGHGSYPYRPAGYPRYYGYGGYGGHYGAYPYYGGYPYYGHHNNNNHNDSAAYLIGGLVVGSLLTNAYHNAQVYPYAQQAAPATQVYVAPQGRRLLRDLNGNCYERTTDGAGNELRSELPPSECNW